MSGFDVKQAQMEQYRAERDALAERVERLETLLDELVKQAMAHGLQVTATMTVDDDEAAGR